MANQRWRDATKSVIAMKQVIRATEDARATRIRRNNTMDVQDTSFELVLPALVDGSAVTETGSPAAGASPQAPKQAMAKVHISTTGRFTTTTGPTSTTDTPSSPTSPISSIFVTTHPQSGSIARRLYGNLVDFILNSYWRSRGKKIQASEAVLATYHESWLHGKVPLNMQVRAALRVGPIAIMLNVVEFLFSALSLFFYVRSTYGVFLPSIIQALQLVFTLYFLVDYSLKVYSAAVRIYYVFSLHGIVDLVSSFPSAFFYGRMVPGIGGIPQLFLTFRILRLLKKMLSLILVGSTVFQRIIYLLVYTFGSVFFSAGLFQWVENMASNGNYVCSGTAQDCIDFFEAMYFVIVTMATVGYGDISPRTYPGRLLVILLIIAAIVILPGQISKILEMAARRPYGGSFDTTKVVGSRFVLLCGTISFQTVQTFLSEFYHPMHDQDLAAYPLRVVIMAPFKPTFEVKSLLALYAEMVEFFEGSAINTVDLDRVSARAATAIFILANGRAQDPDNEDASQIVRALSMHRYCGPFTRARIIVELLKPESQTSAIWDDTEGRVEAICPEELRFNLLARSCAVRGLTTFITNLFKSGVTLADGGKEKKKSLSEPWMAEYFRGSSQEVYPVLLPPILHKLRFEEAAEFVFRHSGSLLFGLDVTLLGDGEGESMSRGILLFPKGHSITPEDVGLVIADSVRDAERVSKCVDPGSNSVCAFHRRKNADALPSHMSSLVCCCSCPFPLSCVQRKQREWEQAKALLAEVRERWKTHSAKKGHDHDHDDNYDNVMFKAGGGSDECSAVPPSHVPNPTPYTCQ